MRQTDQLIENLANESTPVKPMGSPLALAFRLAAVLLIYAGVVGYTLGWRQDLFVQMERPAFLVEIILLVLLSLSSLWSCVHLVFPDQYQSRLSLYLPVGTLLVLLLVLAIQYFLPLDTRMIIPELGEDHAMKCTLCIAAVAILPSALMLLFMRQGASTHSRMAGAYSVLAATGIGCFMLRLSEANDSITHLMTWHYVPTLIFAVIGAAVGKLMLKW